MNHAELPAGGAEAEESWFKNISLSRVLFLTIAPRKAFSLPSLCQPDCLQVVVVLHSLSQITFFFFFLCHSRAHR